MNVEQITCLASLAIAPDQPLSPKEQTVVLCKWLGNDCVTQVKFENRKVNVFRSGNKQFVLLTKAVTYLGKPHPVYKKRIQLPDWYQPFCNRISSDFPDVEVRFLGIYNFDDNVVFVDFHKDTYMEHGLHNSSAHVCVNDLYQGMTYGVHKKIDRNGNTLVVIRSDKFKRYLEGQEKHNANLLELFERFNSDYPFGQWLQAVETIREMQKGGFSQWRQTEWPGYYLEFKFDRFCKSSSRVQSLMQYIGSTRKNNGKRNFDIYFVTDNFYGDLKASDIEESDAPGNDQQALRDNLYRYKKFWYVIYEHETIKDSQTTGYSATIGRNQFIKSVDQKYKKNLLSYKDRMKHSVRFKQMCIVELNAVNASQILKSFNQGHQPDGSKRAPKFLINKRVLRNDNFVIFRYADK